jgi:uncharacterized protein involved in outer membrane biogenesis
MQISAPAPAPSRWRHRFHVVEIGIALLTAGVIAGFCLLATYWPFRYREVHPLLEETFQSRVVVQHYHRTYFPHPGYVAEGVTFYRHGDTRIPPLATMHRMTVVGRWTNLLFHPHKLHEIRLDGLRVQIPPAGTTARGTDFDQGMVSSSTQKIEIETIVADGSTLDFLHHNGPPLRFQLPHLVVREVRQGKPLSFEAHVLLPRPQGLVATEGRLGPFDTNNYGATPLSGSYALQGADLRGVDDIRGHATAKGAFHGNLNQIAIDGDAAIPDFRAGTGHQVSFDSAYHVTVNGTNGDVDIHDAAVRTGASVITAKGTVSGTPKKVSLQIATRNSHLDELLKVVEEDTPTVSGNVSFQADVELPDGQEKFLQRLGLKGRIAISAAHFLKADTQQNLDSFSARVRKDPPNAAAHVDAQAKSETLFAHGTAYFRNVEVNFPGATAELTGTMNLLDTKLHFTGEVALEQSLSHAATGWKSVLLKPLSPFFKHKDAGAVVSIAVTGTAKNPQIGQDILHNK